MSVEAKRWVLEHSPAKGAARAVLENLAWHSDRRGKGARRSWSLIADETGLSRATIHRALTLLKAEGMIRQHVDCVCKDCRRRGRGVVVYDVVLAVDEDVAPGQFALEFGVTETPRQTAPDPSQSETGGSRSDQSQGSQDDTGTRLNLRPITTLTTVDHQQQDRGREDRSGLATTVAEVTEILGRVVKEGWFIDPIAVEAIVMTHTHRDARRAAAAVVASAYDHHHVNAAKQLRKQLEWQPSDNEPRAPRRAAPGEAPPAELPERFSKYDVAMGLAG